MISRLITQIEKGEIVLPAIQRDFVWEKNRITKLFDSIMRGYPLGIILLWETYLDIKYREFAGDYQFEAKSVFKDNKKNERIKLVLDGQQRLQSIFIALNGSIDGKKLYFDLLSGKTADDFREVFYVFRFLTDKELDETKENIKNKKNDNTENEYDKYPLFMSVKDVLNSTPEERLELKNIFTNNYNLPNEDILRLELNMQNLIHSLTNDTNMLKVSTIDEDKPCDSNNRKTESDILEVFVRINRQGITLNRSDLIFSMLKLNWRESADDLPDFIRDINKGNNFGIDLDFIIRSLIAVSDLGSKFDVDLLRKSSNVEKIKKNYKRTCDAIRALVDFMQDDCNILSSRLVGGYLNLIPIIYYLSYTPDNLVPNGEIGNLKKTLFIFGYTSPFSRYADSRIGKFISEELKPLSDNRDYSFPLKDSIWWANYWNEYESFDSKLLQRNKHLTLHLFQNKTGAKVKYAKNAPEVDHIFPKSTLKDKEYDLGLINSYGNFWILAKAKNQNKSNKHPNRYFADVDDALLDKALIPRDMLKYPKFKKFVREREQNILKKIKKVLGINGDELNYSTLWEDDDS